MVLMWIEPNILLLIYCQQFIVLSANDISNCLKQIEACYVDIVENISHILYVIKKTITGYGSLIIS